MTPAPVPPRDWKRWKFAYAAHFLTGCISGAGVGFAVSTGYLPAALSHLLSLRSDWRQTVEWARRRDADTPGRDMGDSIAGWCVGFLAGVGAGILLAVV